MENGLLTQFEGIKDIKKGSLVVLAARPFFGKTKFSYNIAFDVADNNQKAKIYSFGKDNEINNYNQKNLDIDYNPNNKIDDILNNSNGYDLIIIEPLLSLDEESIKKLKDLAVKTNSVVLLIRELRTEIDTRNDKRPLLSDLSDELINNADVILFMYGDYYYKQDYSNGMIIELTKFDDDNITTYNLLRHNDKCTFTNYVD